MSGIRSDINYQNKVQKLANKYNIFYIGSNIPIDSYRLICASELCITFGSTIGAEAALLRTNPYVLELDCMISLTVFLFQNHLKKLKNL